MIVYNPYHCENKTHIIIILYYYFLRCQMKKLTETFLIFLEQSFSCVNKES